ncbi:MAG: hypothetical protein LHV69_04895 [Elusimicrobia bacterium]|nr:hypothetical protein [Candidatus Obscuribacterium magneticum]MCB4756360.1 hypothetical protein [Candidatus Obscuribacterium magneticum]
MKKKTWGLMAPLIITLLVFFVSRRVRFPPSIQAGIQVGVLIALAQTVISMGALKWALKRPYFYWVWGGGILFRLIVFAATAFIVYSYTSLHFVATLISLVMATTLFMLIESTVIFRKA